MTKPPKRPRDPNQLAKLIVDLATGTAIEENPETLSGVLATTTSGLLMGWYQHETFSPQTRMQARAAWSVAVFVLEALLFILIGLSLRGILARFDGHAATTLLPLALLISFGVIAARLVWVFLATYTPLSSTFRISCGEAKSLHESFQQACGNFHAVGVMPGDGNIVRRPKHPPYGGDGVAECGVGFIVPSGWMRADSGSGRRHQPMRPKGDQRV